MAVFILPAAQDDLFSLQAYMLDKWCESDWLMAEDEIFEKLALVGTQHTGVGQHHGTHLLDALVHVKKHNKKSTFPIYI